MADNNRTRDKNSRTGRRSAPHDHPGKRSDAGGNRTGPRASPRSGNAETAPPRHQGRRTGAAGGQRRERSSGSLLLYGLHAVAAAIRNPRRQVQALLATEEGMGRLGDAAHKAGLRITPVSPEDLARRLPRDAVHQGVAVEVQPLPTLTLERVIAIQPERSLFLALDQITDPRNFGAILRASAGFGVRAVIVPERRSAELNGAAARAAAGALDMVPIVQVVNLSRALERLKQADFWITGLDGESDRTLADTGPSRRRVLVLGSEGSGIRRLVGESCDEIVRIEMDRRMESLNVATAAAVALYELSRKDRE
ncbi:MAG: 23S rRNA (guanosine(2251)-2'-O)-methyltransferase RlmB [Geminicoccaceae bacterium]|nr:23S rRNA (guanosine(2251)-2'-O)-methyltransferase RlmB [Geminicoccaceae bacterium]